MDAIEAVLERVKTSIRNQVQRELNCGTEE